MILRPEQKSALNDAANLDILTTEVGSEVREAVPHCGSGNLYFLLRESRVFLPSPHLRCVEAYRTAQKCNRSLRTLGDLSLQRWKQCPDVAMWIERSQHLPTCSCALPTSKPSIQSANPKYVFREPKGKTRLYNDTHALRETGFSCRNNL